MGYYKNSQGIDCFEPDDTDSKMYLEAQYFNLSLTEIKAKIQQKWPGSDLEFIFIGNEYIHTHCIYYDLYVAMVVPQSPKLATMRQRSITSLKIVTTESKRLLTHQKGVSYDDYIDAMRGNRDALRVKREDLRDNSDITRLKGVTEKDIARMAKYQRSFLKVEQ